jgi:hypothetical protein
VPIAAFADPRALLWGVVLGGRDPLLAIAPLGSGGQIQTRHASLSGEPQNGASLDPSREWQITGTDVALTLAPANGGAFSDGAEAVLELCAVSGETRDSGRSRGLDCGGARLLAPTGCDSLRIVACWFESGSSVALLAERPMGTRGHGEDRVSAMLSGEAEGSRVYDPRLSTTYGGDGVPQRAGIELWVGENEDQLRFTRMSLEAQHGGGELSSGGLRVECHAVEGNLAESSGQGVYLLARAC